MNVIFTCGGTAGHINPAIAVARFHSLDGLSLQKVGRIFIFSQISPVQKPNILDTNAEDKSYRKFGSIDLY